MQNFWLDLIPHVLKDYDMHRRVDMSMFLLSFHRTQAWLDDLITGDEKWVHYSNNIRKAQWVDKDKLPDDVAKPELHVKKVMLCVWWSVRGIEHWELLEEGKTITADVYTRQLERLRKKIASSRGEKARVFFQHDNARPHVAKVTNAKLMSFGWTVLPHPPYSPDLAPSDYWLFSSLQHHLDGKDFKSKGDIEKELISFFASKDATFWRNGINKLPERWQKTIDADGHYFH
uniref:Mariner Mos1 transposase n=1 Tax=Caenorhabditis tropicalis TaxID=1561998 RepID=A0A1I7TGJ6_9PELO